MKNWEPITIDDYIQECKTKYKDVWQYVALDVIMDEDQTMRNLDIMADAGLSPMAVLTPTADIEVVPKLLSYNKANRISVSGGAVGKSDMFVASRIVQTHNISGKTAKIHGLGYMRHPQVFNLPLSTIDASSMNSGARYGTMMIYDERKGICGANWKDLANPKSERERRILGTILRTGIKTEHLRDKQYYTGHHSIVNLACLFAYLQYANHATTKGVGLFMSLANYTITAALMAVIDSSERHTFDYWKAREMYFEFMAMKRDKKYDELCDRFHNIMLTHTDWQTNILDDSKEEGKDVE